MPNAKGNVHRMKRKHVSRACGVCAGELCENADKVRPTNARVTRQAAREKELSACVCLGILGEDNLLHIFNLLCLRDLINVSKTCNKFHKLAHTKHLWTNVSLRNTSIHCWRGAVKMFNKFSTIRLDLTWMRKRPPHITSPHWILLTLSHIKSLRQLYFVDEALPVVMLEEVPRILPDLETLVAEIACSVWDMQNTPALDFKKFCSMKNLQQLQLKGVCGIRLPTFSFSRGLNELSKLTNLRVLSLTTLQGVSANMFDFLPALVHLHTLRLGNCTHWDLEVYQNLGLLTGLEHLYLENSGASPDICVALGNLTRLKVLELVIFILPADLSIILPSLPLLHTVVLVPHAEEEMGEVNCNCLSIIQSLQSCGQLRKLRWGIITHQNHLSHTHDDNTESVPMPCGCVSLNTTNEQLGQTVLGDGEDEGCLANEGNSSKSTDESNGGKPSIHTMTLRSSDTKESGSAGMGKRVEPIDDRNLDDATDIRSEEVVYVNKHFQRGSVDDASCSDYGEVLVSVNQLNRVLKPMFPIADVSVSRIYVAEQ
ncbi:Hypp2538 [Branchiostoma lanceolatum]|uniref:Hypp2538 protein n=1 Tax=Branchiostoma lanceolatum TaxID=7740 RepID=A0A8J9ZRP9_BRALA|nr:Hypp2538 [Branchiostoma lanceolatum]